MYVITVNAVSRLSMCMGTLTTFSGKFVVLFSSICSTGMSATSGTPPSAPSK